jgi:hypothetical protein
MPEGRKGKEEKGTPPILFGTIFAPRFFRKNP